MIIYLDKYRKAKLTGTNAIDLHDEERLCVNSNPVVRAVALSCYQTPHELSPQLPDESSTIDTEAFLDRVYALATQV